MPRLAVRHEARYRYVKPVTFCDHCMMFRPWDSQNLRLLKATLDTQPVLPVVTWTDAAQQFVGLDVDVEVRNLDAPSMPAAPTALAAPPSPAAPKPRLDPPSARCPNFDFIAL